MRSFAESRHASTVSARHSQSHAKRCSRYGDTSIVHTFPPTSVIPMTSASGWSGPSNTAASASTRATSDLVQQRSECRAYNSDPAECQCCGFTTHCVPDCPFKGLHDTNNQHHVLWSEPTMGKAWMAEGHDTFVEHLYLPGWELRRKKRTEEFQRMLIHPNVSVNTASLRTTGPHETYARSRSGRETTAI